MDIMMFMALILLVIIFAVVAVATSTAVSYTHLDVYKRQCRPRSRQVPSHTTMVRSASPEQM